VPGALAGSADGTQAAGDAAVRERGADVDTHLDTGLLFNH